MHKFKGEIEGYTVNYWHAQGWRLPEYDQDDFMQMSWLVFAKCLEFYYDTEPKHFMALYKTALDRRVINLHKAYKRRLHTEPIECMMINDEDATIGETENAGYLKRLVAQAPTEVRLVLNLFLSAPSEILEAAMLAWRGNGNVNAGGNEHVCKLLGLPEGSKPLDAVHDYFTK